MFFQCKNCGGNAVFSPETQKMHCPFCESEESAQRVTKEGAGISICPNCSGEVVVAEHTAATKCPYCDSYLILDERVEGENLPRMVIPFQIGAERCREALRTRFKKNLFAPADFLSDARLKALEGHYVLYWFYDYQTNCVFRGEGTRVRSWTAGDTHYTETSHFAINRDMDIAFSKIPVDASEQMPDTVMDLMEPYDYAAFKDFSPEYLSGFWAEKYNESSESLEKRANQKMKEDAETLLNNTVTGYSTVIPIQKDVNPLESSSAYGLLPVWKYHYTYQGKEYPFYVNGQTAKIVGNAPLSKKKAAAYTLTLWGCLTALLIMMPMIWNWLQ
jgi:DNA-directed RNA polymerase subunit RPC12/RpoP